MLISQQDRLVRLRSATAADAQACAKLHAQLLEPAWDCASFASSIFSTLQIDTSILTW